MSAQSERRISDDEPGHAADERGSDDTDPWRDPGLHEQQRNGVRAESEECRMPEGEQPRVAAEQVERDADHGPDQDDREDDSSQKLDAQQERPDVNLARPLGTPRLRLAMMRLGHLRVGLELRDQAIVGEALAQPVPGIERNHNQQQHDRDVIRRAQNCPQLMQIHG